MGPLYNTIITGNIRHIDVRPILKRYEIQTNQLIIQSKTMLRVHDSRCSQSLKLSGTKLYTAATQAYAQVQCRLQLLKLRDRNNQPSVIAEVSAIKMYVQKLLLCKEDYESSQKLCGHSLLETNDNLTVEKITKDWDEAYRLIWDNVQVVQPFIGSYSQFVDYS